jgi:sugar-specific transcriptional regulator TrmB
MSEQTAEESLVQLGLTRLEACIYTFLLRESPATGYRVAKALGKPAANVYKAMETLEGKGAIEVDRGHTKVCRPVPVAELIHLLESRFKRQRDQAFASLRRLPGPSRDTRVYQLRDRDHVFGKVRQLLENAQHDILLDVFPILSEIRSDIEQAVARGLSVAMKIYTPDRLPGAEVVLEPEHERIRKRWPAQWIVMVVDGSETLIALLTQDGSRVIQAVWSGSPFLSWIHHSGLGSEIAYTALRQELEKGADREAIIRTITKLRPYFASEAPGYHRLLHQLGLSPSSEDRNQDV